MVKFIDSLLGTDQCMDCCHLYTLVIMYDGSGYGGEEGGGGGKDQLTTMVLCIRGYTIHMMHSCLPIWPEG